MGKSWRCLLGDARVQGQRPRKDSESWTHVLQEVPALSSICADQVSGQSPKTPTALPAPSHCRAVTAVTQNLRESQALSSAEAKGTYGAPRHKSSKKNFPRVNGRDRAEGCIRTHISQHGDEPSQSPLSDQEPYLQTFPADTGQGWPRHPPGSGT